MDEETIQIAGCVIADDYGRLLLLHKSFNDSGLWYLPGGKVEDEEAPESAAIRGAWYDLGVAVSLEKSLGNAAFEHDGQQYVFYWFYATVQDGEIKALTNDDYDDLDYFELEDMPSLALAAGAEILEVKIASGEVVL